ncbi:MAG: leucyl/phenylalanyl-tRNA--protein transferase [Chitinophagaceae bacterium]
MLAVLNENIWFPPADKANEDGLLAIGGDLSIERLLHAYKLGIFPWYSGDVILWWNPNPRFVLFPEKLKISKSMHQVLRGNTFDFSINQNFKEVISLCKTTTRKGEDGTWIDDDMVEAYNKLHQLGYAISVEVWHKKQLVGGLYGIKIGQIFFGESMFSTMSNASKFGFIKFTEYLIEQNITLIDCQVYTQHLESLGAEMIERKTFLEILKNNIK